MKTMTCRQLAGACNIEFHAETWEKMAEMSKQHGTEMFNKGDKPHLDAMEKMKELMNKPEEMKEWFDKKQKEFDALREDK